MNVAAGEIEGVKYWVAADAGKEHEPEASQK
jgi:hypothetical protein